VASRQEQIKQWLEKEISLKITSLTPASEDASFRRYFRVYCEPHKFDNSKSMIVMDAPPQRESIQEFVAIAKVLTANMIHAPRIYAINSTHGFVLIEDLGRINYLDRITDQAESLYAGATNALVKLQTIGCINGHGFERLGFGSEYQPPSYNERLVDAELELYTQWYCAQHKQFELSNEDLSIWTELKTNLIDNFSAQPQCWVHRDFHSRNLMITEDNSPGVIDFQDLVWGPITYDLASIFKDCYIEWPRNRQLAWLEVYLNKIDEHIPTLNICIDEFVRWYDLTGFQRHLKVLGIFSRLNYRDNKKHYLNDLPLVEKYILEVFEIYPEFDDFRRLFNKVRK